MKIITDFQYQNDSSFVGWMYGEEIIKKIYDFKIYAILMRCQLKVLVLELRRNKDNAIILNADGTEFRRIINPDLEAVCFGDVYYIKDELTLISRRNDSSMIAVVIDENGMVIRTYEAR